MSDEKTKQQTSEHEHQEKARRGEHAKHLLEDPVLVQALDNLEAQYIEAWKNTASDEEEGRERLYRAVQVVGDVRQQLRVIVDQGRISRDHIEKVKHGGGRRRR